MTLSLKHCDSESACDTKSNKLSILNSKNSYLQIEWTCLYSGYYSLSGLPKHCH